MNTQGSNSLIFTTLVANSPQVLLTFLYFSYNGIFTCMLQGKEWNEYAHKRRTLRVSSPKGMQRSTYRLQLPYRYGIPLLIVSGILHWFVSQSIFLARVTVLDSFDNEVPEASVSTCGYSLIAIISVMVLGAVVVFLGIHIGFRRYKVGMPFAGSCSAAISAACHPPQSDTNAFLKPVMWGVVSHESDGVGHCSFTSFQVKKPIKGRFYASLESKIL